MKRTALNWVGVCLAVLILTGCDLSDFLGAMRPQPPDPGLRLVLQPEPVKSGEAVTAEQLQVTRDILEMRAKNLGVSNASVQVGSDGTITVKVPAVDDPDALTQAMVGRGFVELLDGGDSPPPEGEVVVTDLGGPPLNGPQPGNSKVWQVVVTSDEMDASKIALQFDAMTNEPQVAFTFNSAGAKKFADFTSNNIGKFMPIVLDKKVISTPIIQARIPGGSGIINGLGLVEARTLAAQLKAEMLPVNLQLLETATIQP
ncbi:MAG TPA: hypothetical protein VJ183_15630 [Chloroflexia bacterium]|nr:hypothetical protein [Chloroflexia bacterium]